MVPDRRPEGAPHSRHAGNIRNNRERFLTSIIFHYPR
jgi:hypothetical protein